MHNDLSKQFLLQTIHSTPVPSSNRINKTMASNKHMKTSLKASAQNHIYGKH